jgi:hypothetical protein
VSGRCNPLHAEKRPRRKATPKAEKAPARGLSPRQRVLFSIGADLIRAIYPQRLQGTMFAHWVAQDFDTNGHSYSLQSLVKASDRYAATYGMPRAGRSTIASRSRELASVNVESREEVGISDKDGRLRRMVQSNHYVLDVSAMIKTLHEADPEQVMPIWGKITRSMEEDQDHSIWTLNWTHNWTLNWCYSSTSSMPSASASSTTCSSSTAPGCAGGDDAAVDTLFSGEGLDSSPSAGVEDDLPSSPAPSPAAARPREDRGAKDEWARYVIDIVSKSAQELSCPGVNPSRTLIDTLNILAEKHSRPVVEDAIGWCIYGFAKNHPHLVFMDNPGGYLTSLLASIVRDYVVARNRQAERLGEDPEKFDLAQWCWDQEEAERDAHEAAEQAREAHQGVEQERVAREQAASAAEKERAEQEEQQRWETDTERRRADETTERKRVRDEHWLLLEKLASLKDVSVNAVEEELQEEHVGGWGNKNKWLQKQIDQFQEYLEDFADEEKAFVSAN